MNRRADEGPPVTVTVNGDPVTLEAGTTVDLLVARVWPTEHGVAVAIGREVVPRSAWVRTVLAAGDRVEIVGAAPGG